LSIPQIHPPVAANQKPKLLDQVRETIRRKHYSLRTEAAYVDWIKKYIFFHNKRHPSQMGAPELEQLMASLLYGSGLRLMECLRLRVKDIDFEYQQVTFTRRAHRK
jgi:integrase